MGATLTIILVLIVLFFLFILWKNSSESFSNSLGGFLIKWDAEPSADSYNILIKDESGAIVESQTGLTSNQYFFRNGNWHTTYTTEVYAVNSVGVSSPSTVVYTSPQGPYIPTDSDISNIRVVGATTDTTIPLSNMDMSINVGDELYGLAVVFDSEASYASPTDVIQLPFTDTGSEHLSDDYKTAVYCYGMIIYESAESGRRSYYLLPTDLASVLWQPYIKDNYVMWSTGGVDASKKDEPSCSKPVLGTPFPKSYFSGGFGKVIIGCLGDCPCPIKVSAGDRFTTVLLFVQPYSGAYSSLIKVQGFREPPSPANVTYSWEPVEGFDQNTFSDKIKRMDPEALKNFILQHAPSS